MIGAAEAKVLELRGPEHRRDRQILPQIVIAALRRALATHGGGYNQMTLDDTRGKKK